MKSLKKQLIDNALDIINKIKNGEIRQADVKNNQEKFKSDLGEKKRKQQKQIKKAKKKRFVQY